MGGRLRDCFLGTYSLRAQVLTHYLSALLVRYLEGYCGQYSSARVSLPVVHFPFSADFHSSLSALSASRTLLTIRQSPLSITHRRSWRAWRMPLPAVRLGHSTSATASSPEAFAVALHPLDPPSETSTSERGIAEGHRRAQ